MRLPLCAKAVAVVLAVVNFLGSGGVKVAAEQAKPSTEAPSGSGPNAAIERFRIRETRKGERLWDVEADRAEVFEERGIAVLTRVVHPVQITIYRGKEQLVTFADKAVVDLKTKNLQLSGRVRCESSEGTRIFSESLHWSAGNRKITTDAPVVIEKAGFQIQGKGMEADTVLERMIIRERVVSRVTLSGRAEQRR
ncbi:MAG: LPS export ABC transporter periplasmic protein LptC [Candidatus Methylomirabilales bacterium]